MRIDLHNHTIVSFDGFNRLADFERAHRAGKFDVVAITDHHSVEGALRLRERASFPVIVGQEIVTSEGEVIGLFTEQPVPRGLSAAETVARIKDQGGLVYVPHPFLPLIAKTLARAALLRLLPSVDIVEVHNGRLTFMPAANAAAVAFAAQHGLLAGAGSDAHVPCELGAAAVEVPGLSEAPLTPSALLSALARGRTLVNHRPSLLRGFLERVFLFAYGKMLYAGKGALEKKM